LSRSAIVSASEPIDNRLFILILQHPREKKEPLATAALTAAMLHRAALVVGLSWPNLAAALGRPADPRQWGVLYLGSARPHRLGTEDEVIALDRDQAPARHRPLVPSQFAGVVLLDGSWREAKALWWRNPWLLKLQRLVLNPHQPSRYARLRREPRREALSTIEAAALLLSRVEGRPEIEATLNAALDRLVAAAQPGPQGPIRPSADR
jgi:DTW domain-containing protein YfiP